MRMPRRIALSIVTAVALAGLGIVGAQNASNPRRPIIMQADQFDLLNDKGKVVASIAAVPQGYPGIAIQYGADRKVTTQMYWIEPGSLYILHEDRQGRFNAALMLDPKDGRAHFGIEDTVAKSGIEFGIGDKGEPYILRRDKSGAVHVESTTSAPP